MALPFPRKGESSNVNGTKMDPRLREDDKTRFLRGACITPSSLIC